MIKIKMLRTKPLLYWSAFSRVGLALGLSVVMWALALGITYSS